MGSTEASPRVERLVPVVEKLIEAGYPDWFIDELVREHIVVDLRNLETQRRQAELN